MLNIQPPPIAKQMNPFTHQNVLSTPPFAKTKEFSTHKICKLLEDFFSFLFFFDDFDGKGKTRFYTRLLAKNKNSALSRPDFRSPKRPGQATTTKNGGSDRGQFMVLHWSSASNGHFTLPQKKNHKEKSQSYEKQIKRIPINYWIENKFYFMSSFGNKH